MIRIEVAGTTSSGKTAIKQLLAEALAKEGFVVELVLNDELKPRSEQTHNSVIQRLVGNKTRVLLHERNVSSAEVDADQVDFGGVRFVYNEPAP